MPVFEVHVTEIASGYYRVEAENAEAAKQKVASGNTEADEWHDLGHDDMQIHDTKEIT